jgi:hypothetical protein
VVQVTSRLGALTIRRPLGGLADGVFPCVVWFDEHRRAHRVEVTDPRRATLLEFDRGLGGEDLAQLDFEGQFSDGVPFRGRFAIVEARRPVSFGRDATTYDVTRVLRVASFESGAHPFDLRPATWSFALANLPLRYGDRPRAPEHEGPQSRDTIDLSIRGRPWELRTVGGASRTDALGFPSDPAVTLRTDRRPAESADDISAAARGLHAALSLAHSRFVRWARLDLEHDGSVSWSRSSPLWWPSGEPQGFQHVTQEGPGELRAYLEQCTPTIEKEIDWWETSIDWYLQATLSPYAEFKLLSLLTLLERISGFVRTMKGLTRSRDVALDEILADERFRPELDALLRRGTAAWTSERTERMIAWLRQRSGSSGYGALIVEACRALDVPPPPSDALRLRDRLAHGYERGVSIESLLAAFESVEETVALLLLRLMGYEGMVFLSRPPRRVPIADALSRAR